MKNDIANFALLCYNMLVLSTIFLGYLQDVDKMWIKYCFLIRKSYNSDKLRGLTA